MKLQLHAKNYKDDLTKVKNEINRILNSLIIKFKFIEHSANYTNITLELNKELTFSLKLSLNLINLGKTVEVNETNSNLFTAINNIKQKMTKQLQRIKSSLNAV